jgi:hypothetical protein
MNYPRPQEQSLPSQALRFSPGPLTPPPSARRPPYLPPMGGCDDEVDRESAGRCWAVCDSGTTRPCRAGRRGRRSRFEHNNRSVSANSLDGSCWAASGATLLHPAALRPAVVRPRGWGRVGGVLADMQLSVEGSGRAVRVARVTVAARQRWHISHPDRREERL